jgi:hypothetical protein
LKINWTVAASASLTTSFRSSERHIAAHPHALFLRRGDLVANALAGDLALELGEREQHVERHTNRLRT